MKKIILILTTLVMAVTANAQKATIESLQKRIDLWDGVHRQITNRTTTANSTLPKAGQKWVIEQ